MSNKTYCKNLQQILQRMGYRRFYKGYVKPVAFTCYIFVHREKEDKYFLEYWFIGAQEQPLLWKSNEVSKENLDKFTVYDFQTLEANTGRYMWFSHGVDGVQFVPPITTEELVSKFL